MTKQQNTENIALIHRVREIATIEVGSMTLHGDFQISEVIQSLFSKMASLNDKSKPLIIVHQTDRGFTAEDQQPIEVKHQDFKNVAFALNEAPYLKQISLFCKLTGFTDDNKDFYAFVSTNIDNLSTLHEIRHSEESIDLSKYSKIHHWGAGDVPFHQILNMGAQFVYSETVIFARILPKNRSTQESTKQSSFFLGHIDSVEIGTIAAFGVDDTDILESLAWKIVSISNIPKPITFSRTGEDIPELQSEEIQVPEHQEFKDIEFSLLEKTYFSNLFVITLLKGKNPDGKQAYAFVNVRFDRFDKLMNLKRKEELFDIAGYTTIVKVGIDNITEDVWSTMLSDYLFSRQYSHVRIFPKSALQGSDTKISRSDSLDTEVPDNEDLRKEDKTEDSALNSTPQADISERDNESNNDHHTTISKTSLILGWPTQFESDKKVTATKTHPLMKKHRQSDMQYTVKYESDGHLVTFAPTGSGKGVSVIIPNLLHYSGPVIVIDPKGENFAVTARYRKSLGQRILLLDPFEAVSDKVLEKHNVVRARLNPLDLFRLPDASIENDSQMIADLLSDEGIGDSKEFWDRLARKVLSGMIAFEVELAQKQGREPSFRNIIRMMFSDEVDKELARKLDKNKPSDFVRMSLVSGFVGMTAKETKDGILATVQSYLSTIMSDEVQAYLNNSTIDIGDIHSKEDYTLYIVIPPNKLKSHSVLLKIWIGVLLHTIMERKRLPAKRTLFILDECANLGRMDALSKAITLMRGYGLQVWMFFQDLSQLEDLYPLESTTMINNCGILQAFGISRKSGAKPLASIIGQMTANDILSLGHTQQVLSISPGKIRRARLIQYYKDDAFKGLFEDNPLILKNVSGVRKSSLIRHNKKTRFS